MQSTALSRQDRALFPQVDGWKLEISETVYKPDNLWDLIDGAADLFLEYNFVDLHLGRYYRAPNLEIKVELYRHATPVDAFGMYSQERYPDYHFVDLGVQGYIEKGVVNFLSGSYYVKITSVQAGSEVQDALLAIAQKVEPNLKQPRTWPALLEAFPIQGKQAQSEQYIARSFLGYSFLNKVFMASYDDGAPFKSFVIQREGREEIGKMLEEYKKALQGERVTSREGGFYEIQDPHNGRLDLLWRENLLCGIFSAEDTKDRSEFLMQIVKNLMSPK